MRSKYVFSLLIMMLLLLGSVVVSAQEFKIKSIEPVGNCVEVSGVIRENCHADFEVYVANVGESGSMNVELGIHKTDWLRDSGYGPIFSIVNDAPNCVDGQNNVDTKEVYLEKNKGVTLTFNVVMPGVNDKLDRSYSATSVAYLNCASDGVDTGVTSAPYTSLVIADQVWLVDIWTNDEETCFDNQRNQAETDIDCGGNCISCESGFMCKVNSDCQDHTKCIDGRCKLNEDVTAGEEVKNVFNEASVVVGKWALVVAAFGVVGFGFWFLLRKLGVFS